ncbi:MULTISPECIES: rod-binding protein [Pantoea]|jgi:flagellar protein FlgJ|uniref:Rod-binding protein n=1 Tax=Pantoea brenneri TaxID=472694 RepID=A0A7Y6NHI7_9GAMM|nr:MULTISPECIES: rod-binding protein [Pantoea]KKD30792.1 peptidoglycan hydrolase [Pantoea sp. 3.5.1]MBZ6397219.1 rod-binding protein [Pantoea sp.]MBZ6440402.1 rod-binding protein [Pantoea sp.]MCQ5473175.1 rod-binding protein [Pantoea brenneri]MDU4127751.1 rod-binding protein [Pantoea sp.]
MLDAITRNSAMLPGDMTGQVKPQNLEQAAEQFEAMFLRSLMKEMRKASQALADGNPFDSKQQRMMQEFYDDKLTSQLASQRSTGIAQMIITQLGPQQSAAFKNSQSMAALQQHPQLLKTPVVPVMRRGQE